MLGGPLCVASSRAATRRSRADPDANTTRHGWMLEFDGACTARARASFTNSCGTGLGKNSRVEWRSMIICSRSNMVAPPGERVIDVETSIGFPHFLEIYSSHPRPAVALGAGPLGDLGHNGFRQAVGGDELDAPSVQGSQ